MTQDDPALCPNRVTFGTTWVKWNSIIKLMTTYLFWVTAEVSDVFLDPLERLPLIPKSQISGENLVAHRKETQGAQAIVDGDQNLLIAEKRLLLLLFRNRGR